MSCIYSQCIARWILIKEVHLFGFSTAFTVAVGLEVKTESSVMKLVSIHLRLILHS